MTTVEIANAPFQEERHARRRSWLFVGLMIVLTILALPGFSPRYFWPLLTGQPLLPLMHHWGIAFHSVLNLAWLAFFVLQVWLVWRGRTDLHIRLGPWLAAYGALLVVIDYLVGMVIEAHRVALGETVDRVLPMTFAVVRDLVMFAGFLIAGVIYRRQPAIHRRSLRSTDGSARPTTICWPSTKGASRRSDVAPAASASGRPNASGTRARAINMAQ